MKRIKWTALLVAIITFVISALAVALKRARQVPAEIKGDTSTTWPSSTDSWTAPSGCPSVS